MSDELEVRHLDGLRASREGGESPKLLGYAVRTGVLSEDLGGFREIIEPHALTHALAAARDVVMLHNHDTARVLGRTSARTLRVQQDAEGLAFELDPPASARDLVESVERGDVTGASFAFSGARDRWDETTQPPTRHIARFTLRDISIVPFPAYPQTHVALRSLDQHRQTSAPKEITVETTVAPPVVDLVPPVPPVVTDRAAPDAAEVRVLGRGDSFRGWVEERSKHPKEYAHLRLGDVLRALVTGPRNALERRALSEGTDSAGGFSVPDILAAQWIDRLRNALAVVRAGAVTVPLTSDVTKIARLLSDPVAAWRSENAAVAESDPTFER